MNRKIKLLKMCFLIGAIFDGLVIIPMLFPSIGAFIFGINNFNPGAEYKYAMYVASSLMAGWTVLLIWGYLSPIERKAILLFTSLPVLIGLISASIFAVASGFISFYKMIPTIVFQSLLFMLFIYCYNINRE